MENFTPWSALAGGAMIGLSALILMLGLGRVAGISGIAGGLLRPDRRELPWRGAFVVGLVLGPVLYVAVSGAPVALEVSGNFAVLVSGGLLVGFGTRLGPGSAVAPFAGGNGGVHGDGGSGGVRGPARGLEQIPSKLKQFATTYLRNINKLERLS